jgi:hypothetical protein
MVTDGSIKHLDVLISHVYSPVLDKGRYTKEPVYIDYPDPQIKVITGRDTSGRVRRWP